ncbi:MAG: PQQ-dependent sugar dehydrogenase [Flavobacterium sp.]|nr:PQQ-dependent sugar dehydrogenase [Flavobacterium sp.]
MKNATYLLLGASFLLLSCGDKSASNGNTAANDTITENLPPVETNPKVTDLSPAFAGQTRIPGVRTETPYEARIITKDLAKPWSVKSLPDGRLLITEKSGAMRIVSKDGDIGKPLAGLLPVDDKGQGGLLDVCLDPQFPTNRMIYWTFSETRPGGNLTAVAKGKLSTDENKIENATVIYRAIPVYDGDKHYGSRVVFDGKGNLYVSTGERSDMETRPLSQSLQSALGKVIRITTDGKAASGNPSISQDALPEIYSYGHRNPQGLAIHPATGDLWLSEMGPKGGDEINLVAAGKNYGWPIITYGVEYSGKTIGEGISQKEGMEQPVYYWDPVTSPSGMTFYSGGAMQEWDNNLFICGLSGQHIMRIVLENNRVVGEERLLENEGERFRDITQGTDGSLYAVTDSGRLYRISKK